MCLFSVREEIMTFNCHSLKDYNMIFSPAHMECELYWKWENYVYVSVCRERFGDSEGHELHCAPLRIDGSFNQLG